MDLTKQIVKIKRLQAIGSVNPTMAIIIPKRWIDELGWNRATNIILEFLPHRKMIILSDEKAGNIKSK